ncbi:CPBP family intramembrane glutamic endopeptidase [Methanobacterium alcaliphilum]|uniref:CPBP family intramembrane glutamic endopeptidase n=1 Tax=Methanobacterium alcaliphilum TaxID=392018 RepID=UPI00200B2E86|nr:type II CAAX endopeptidase family protein [Methanobacterium alcaliphilum]MCK9150416.1 CPBP family intramembrane metalloprotease [Methanobacterium alcaliphilum]
MFLEKRQLKKELFVFLIITFAATYLLDFMVYMIYGLKTTSNATVWGLTPVAHMLFPAAAAIICMFYFKSSALTRETKIVFALFFSYMVLFFFETYVYPIMGTIGVLPLASSVIAILGFLTVFMLHLKKQWRRGLKPSRLFIGKNLRYYIILPVAIFTVILASLILNYITGLGVPSQEFNLYLFFVTFINMMFMGIFLLWPSVFGEEYGWRVYLQDRLFPLLGGYRGVLVLGIIWGIWHTPTILLGNNFPGQPILGNVAMIFFTIAVGIILSYAVLKTGSVWIAVLIHLIIDMMQVPSETYIAISIHPVFSFGSGIYGSVIIAVFSIILLRSKVWKNLKIRESN